MIKEQYQRNIEHKKFLLETKNKLIAFCFLTVFSMIGVSLTNKAQHPEYFVDCFIYVMPFFILVPLSSRIVYYRMWDAYIGAELHVKGPEYFDLKFPPESASEISCPDINCYKLQYPFPVFYNISKILQKIIDVMVNFEVFILALCCFLLFFFKTWPLFKVCEFWWWILYSIPILSTLYIFLICKVILNYGALHEYHVRQWTWYMEASITTSKIPKPEPQFPVWDKCKAFGNALWKKLRFWKKEPSPSSAPSEKENSQKGPAT